MLDISYSDSGYDTQPKYNITKKFWKYIKSKKKKQKSSGVATLNENGHTQEDKFKSKAEALNNQFQSVFTEENMASFPNKRSRNCKIIETIER